MVMKHVAWEVALESEQTPTSLVLTRQNLPTLDVDKQTVENGVRKGAYIVLKQNNNLNIYYWHLIRS